MAKLEAFLIHRWYSRPGWLWLLWPLEWLVKLLVRFRQRQRSTDTASLGLPVIVVGNLTVGGTGKSPLIAALVKLFKAQGLESAIISRGYQRNAPGDAARLVASDDSPAEVGDEPLMLKRQLPDTPVVVGRQRRLAAQRASRETVDFIVSDDGMQHYALPRSLEIAVIDAKRGLGNGHCLPLGPLREPPARLDTVDALVLNGVAEGESLARTLAAYSSAPQFSMNLQPVAFVNLLSGERIDCKRWQHPSGHAVAGIGNPQRFFTTLDSLGLAYTGHSFSDHHHFTPEDFSFDHGEQPLVMTEKDAVKCHSFARPHWWYLAVEARLEEAFQQWLKQQAQQLLSQPLKEEQH